MSERGKDETRQAVREHYGKVADAGPGCGCGPSCCGTAGLRGMLTTIGRAKAVAQLGPLHVYGLLAWLLWCIVHIFFLIGFRNRVRVMLEWMWYYVTFKPGARLLFEQPGQPHNEPRTRHP